MVPGKGISRRLSLAFFFLFKWSLHDSEAWLTQNIRTNVSFTVIIRIEELCPECQLLPPFLNISLCRDSTMDHIRMYIDAFRV